MESIEIDIKMGIEWEGEGGGVAGKKKRKQAQGDAHYSSHGECLSKQWFLSLGRVPAEQ